MRGEGGEACCGRVEGLVSVRQVTARSQKRPHYFFGWSGALVQLDTESGTRSRGFVTSGAERSVGGVWE